MLRRVARTSDFDTDGGSKIQYATRRFLHRTETLFLARSQTMTSQPFRQRHLPVAPSSPITWCPPARACGASRNSGTPACWLGYRPFAIPPKHIIVKAASSASPWVYAQRRGSKDGAFRAIKIGRLTPPDPALPNSPAKLLGTMIAYQ